MIKWPIAKSKRASRERCDLGLLAYSSLRMEKVWRPLEDVESGA